MSMATRLYTDGQWADAANAATFEVVNPATGEVLAQVADAQPSDVRAMIDAAARVQESWGNTPAPERARVMRRAASIFTNRLDELATLLTQEQGKPLDQARAELQYGIGFLEWFAEEARRVYGSTVPANTPNKRIVTFRQPAGVAACITPWNFPALQILRKLSAALAAGCTMIIKPAELTPLSALAIADVFDEAGLPAGVVQVAPALDPVGVGAALMDDPRVRVVSFTGSTEVGKILMQQAAGTMKRVSLELGGHAPFIVFDDADLDLAVSEAMSTKLRNMGQTCVSANRFYVHRDVARRFTQMLAEAFAALKVGDGLADDVTVGPLVEEAAVLKVERHVADAIARGARVLCGGQRAVVEGRSGLFYEPTIIVDADETMEVAREETFGPVAPIFLFDTDEEVIARANDSVYGLAAYFFTSDISRGIRVAERLEYGAVGLNDASISAVQAPFGGVKESGVGREGGVLGMDEYLDTKYLSIGGV